MRLIPFVPNYFGEKENLMNYICKIKFAQKLKKKKLKKALVVFLPINPEKNISLR
jgi:hypothetical protein